MIVGWSPHTGAAAEGSPRAAIDYLMAPWVRKTLGAERVRVRRDPAPELLRGDPRTCRHLLEALRTKHRYSVATLSFTASDISVADFNAGDPDLRGRVARTLGLFLDVAYAGLPQRARLHPLVGTHTHTGRLEVNILMPRAVWRSDGVLRAYNPHPPGGYSRTLWDHFRDTINHRFGWADPLAYSRRRMISPPGWELKAEREAEHLREHPPFSAHPQAADIRKMLTGLVENLLYLHAPSNRAELLSLMTNELDGTGIILHRVARDSVTFRDGGGVTSRKVVWLFLKQLWLEFVPVLHRLQGRLATQG